MRRRKAFTGETESLNGLLDTMTNVVGVLILMMLASFLTVRQVAQTIEKKSALFTKTREEKMTGARMESAKLDEELAALRTEVENPDAGARSGNEPALLMDARARLGGSSTVVGELLQIDPDAMKAEIREAEKRLSALQVAVALQVEVMEKTRRTSVNRMAGAPPVPRTRIARVPDPVYPSTNATCATILCRYGRVTFYDQQQMESLLKDGYVAATKPWAAKALAPLDLYRKVESYFDANQISRNGLRWRVRAEYDENDTTAKAYIQLRAYIEWTSTGLGETLDGIEEKGSAYLRHLQNLSVKTNYLKFLVWRDSFPEYTVARGIADTHGFSSGWLTQQGDGIEIVMSRTGVKDQSPLEAPHVARGSQGRRGYGPVMMGGGIGGGVSVGAGVPSIGGGGGSGMGAVGFGGGAGVKVD